MAQNETVYVPGSSAKTVKASFGEIINLSFKVEDLGKFCKEHKNEKGYVNLSLVPRKSVGTYGETHSVKLNDWKPAEGQSEQAEKPKAKANKPAPKPEPTGFDDPDAGDDIPF